MEMQYFSRISKSVNLTSGPPKYEKLPGFEVPNGTIRQATYSKDGRLFAYSLPQGVRIIDPNTGHQITPEIPVSETAAIALSPRGKYLVTYQRAKKDEASGNYLPNISIFDTATGALKGQFASSSQQGWQPHFTYDEKYCARLITNNILVYETPNFQTATYTYKLEGVQDFSVSPGQNYSLAAFVGEKQGRPASVQVYQLPNSAQPICRKTILKADKVTMKWNTLGTSLLVLSSTDVDRSGKSYYGETNLYLLGIAGSYDSIISLDKEGPVHDFTWSPNSREFAVTYGYMPSKTMVFDARGNKVHELPTAHRNTILFSPHGRYLLVAGFGNLQGQVDIYDRQRQFVKVSSFEASNTSVCHWSPDGRYIMTATTSPRLRVDNGVKIWHYTGRLIFKEDHDELFSADWRPQDVSNYPLPSVPEPAPKAHPSAASAEIKSSGPPKPKGAYVPPHARLAGGSIAIQGSAPKIPPGFVPGAVPGAAPTPISKNAAKNKRKKENAKLKSAAASAEGSVEDVTNGIKRTSINDGNAEAPAPPANNAPTGSSAEDKKIRSLLKKLRAIDELKQRQINGEKLEDTQVQKISTEKAVRQELQSYGWNGDE